MMITLTNEIKEKIIEETNKERYDNIENIKPYEPFLYIGKFNTLTPKKMSRNKDGELVVTVNQELINNKNYALILEKREDELGKPYLVVKGKESLSFHLSISHEREYSVAMVVIDG